MCCTNEVTFLLCWFVPLLCLWLQAEGEEAEVDLQQLHYQQTGILHTCKVTHPWIFDQRVFVLVKNEPYVFSF